MPIHAPPQERENHNHSEHSFGNMFLHGISMQTGSSLLGCRLGTSDRISQVCAEFLDCFSSARSFGCPKQKMAVLNLEGSKTQKLYSLRLVLCSDGIVLLRSHSLLLGIVPVCGMATREGGNQDCVRVDGKHVLPTFCTPFSFSAPAVFVACLLSNRLL